jgi:hypothetical protein
MNEFEDLTIGKISMIIDDIVNGEANSKEAKYLFDYVIFLNKNNMPIPNELNKFYEDAKKEIFYGKKSIAQAFGFKKKRGRVRDKERIIPCVVDVMENILQGFTKEDAIRLSIEKFPKVPSSIKENFDNYKEEAIHILKIKIILDGNKLHSYNFSLLDKYL